MGEEASLDTEIILNNRPLTYIKEVINYPILISNSLIFGRDVNFLYAGHHESESENMKKQRKYVKRYKEVLLKRWKHEYLVTLGEKHNLKDKDITLKINVGDVVMIKREEKNRGVDIGSYAL